MSSEPPVEHLKNLEMEAISAPLSEVKRNNHFGSYRLYRNGLPNNVAQLNLQSERAKLYAKGNREFVLDCHPSNHYGTGTTRLHDFDCRLS